MPVMNGKPTILDTGRNAFSANINGQMAFPLRGRKREDYLPGAQTG